MKQGVLERRQLVVEGDIWKALLFLAVPVAINNFFNASYDLIDTFFVSSIGSIELAAIAFVGPINSLIRAASDGLAIGGTSLIGREIGREKYEKGKHISLQLLSTAGILGVLIALICFIYSNEILLKAHATDSLLSVADIYFKLTVLSTPLIFINSSYVAIKRANADTLKSMNVNFIAILIKIILTYILIFHFNLGITSLAISTFIGSIFVSIYAIYDLFIRNTLMKLSYKKFKFDNKVLSLLFIMGIPIVLEKSSISFSFIMVNKYILNYGETVLAAYGITNKINSLIFSTVTGFGTGLATIVSQNLGADKAERARDGIKKAFYIAIGTSIVIISIILSYRHSIAGVFARDDYDLFKHTVNAMSVYSISIIPWAVFQVVIGVFEGTGNTKMNLLISFARVYLFRLPLVIILSSFAALHEYSIWYAMLLSNVFTGIFAFILYLRNYKKLVLFGE